MFRKGGLTQRSNYEVGGPTSEDVLRQYEFLKESLPQQRDDRFLRYLSRAGNQLGQKPQGGTTALQRIINAASGDPLERLYSETDERRKYDQGLQSLALERALGEFDRARTMEEKEMAAQRKMDDELETYRKKLEIEKQFGGADDNRTANQIDFEYVKQDLEDRGMSPYNEDGTLSEDFKRSFYFYKTGKEITDEVNESFAMANVSGDKRQMQAAIANNQMQRIKQFHYDRALDSGMDIATVDVYDPTEGLDNYVLYIAEDGVKMGGKNIPGAAYVQRIGDDVKYYDINFQEIMTDGLTPPAE